MQSRACDMFFMTSPMCAVRVVNEQRLNVDVSVATFRPLRSSAMSGSLLDVVTVLWRLARPAEFLSLHRQRCGGQKFIANQPPCIDSVVIGYLRG